MKYFYLVIIAAFLVSSCNEMATVTDERDYFSDFDQLFSSVATDSFVVQYAEWGYDTVDFYTGKPIDSVIIVNLLDTSTLNDLGFADEFYAVARLVRTDSIMGYLIRTQLEEVPYMQETFLFVFDNQNELLTYDKVGGFVGAEGYINETTSMFKNDKEIYIRDYEWTINTEGVEGSKDAVYQLLWKTSTLENQGLDFEVQDEWRKALPLRNN